MIQALLLEPDQAVPRRSVMDTRRKRQGAMRSRLGMIRGTAVAMVAMLQLLPRVGGASFWDNINDVMRQSAPTTPPSTSTASANCPYRYYFLFQVNDEDPAAALERLRALLQGGDASRVKELFATPTTRASDVCSVQLLSTSLQGPDSAIRQAQRSNGSEVAGSSSGRGLASGVNSLWSVVTVKGTGGVTAIQLPTLGTNIASALAGQGSSSSSGQDTTVTTTMSTTRIGDLSAFAGSSLPPRTHTFKSYQQSPVFSSYLPVVFLDSQYNDVLPASTSNDIVALSGGAQLSSNFCRVKNAYRRNRGGSESDWTALAATEMNMFSFQRKGFSGLTGSMALRVAMPYTRFYSSLTSTGTNGMLGQAAVKMLLNTLQISTSVTPGAESFRRELAALSSNTSSSTLSLGPDTTLLAENVAAVDLTQDYAITFSCGVALNAPTWRLDFTLVPKIRRTTQASGYVCEPGSGPGMRIVDKYMPKLSTDQSAVPTSRAHPYTISAESFEQLHPEEAQWVNEKIKVVRPKISTLLSQQLNLTLDEGDKVPRIAISVSGGGKRSLLNGAGVLSGLSSAGVMDISTWIGGLSGGGWLISALHAMGRDGTSLPDAVTWAKSVSSELRKPLFDETFKANEIMTNLGYSSVTLPVPTFNPKDSGQYSQAIGCQGELKLQSPGLPAYPWGSDNLLEYYGRALSYQMLGGLDEAGLGLTFSSLAKSKLLANYSAPLPIMQLQQNTGDGTDGEAFRLWEVSPFDIATHNGSQAHVSFPTALLGTDVTDASKRYMTNHDQLSHLFGISSFAFSVVNEKITGLVCGDRGSLCRPVPLTNPFYRHPDVSDAEVKVPKTVLLTDGGINLNVPVWQFASSTRQADIVVLVDSSAGTKTAPFNRPSFTCHDDGDVCQTKVYYNAKDAANKRCCNACALPMSTSCWGSDDPRDNDLIAMPGYFPDNTLPRAWPRTARDTAGLLNKVTFFGCDEDNRTAVVYFPNRVVVSGKSGFPVDIGVVNINPDLGIQRPLLRPEDVDDILKNGQEQVGALGAPNFKKCFACLVAATAKGRESHFWTTNQDCAGCYDTYCYKP